MFRFWASSFMQAYFEDLEKIIIIIILGFPSNDWQTDRQDYGQGKVLNWKQTIKYEKVIQVSVRFDPVVMEP